MGDPIRTPAEALEEAVVNSCKAICLQSSEQNWPHDPTCVLAHEGLANCIHLPALPDREAIARVIDPVAWTCFEAVRMAKKREGYSEQTARVCAARREARLQAGALTKADAVIALMKGEV